MNRWQRFGVAWAVGMCCTSALVQGQAARTAPPATRTAFSRTAEQEISFQEGLLHYSRNDLDKAAASFGQLVKENPADAEAHYYLGLTQLDQRKPAAAAVESFNQSLRLDPTPTEVRAARATALIRLRQFDAAREDIAVLETDPRWRSLGEYLKGQLLYAQGNLEAAAKAFAAAKAAGGTEAAPAEFYEGLTYLRMRELVRARSVFREASVGADRDPTVAAASRQLDAVLATQQRRAKPWEIQITTSFEYDSNVILLGSNVAQPDEVSGTEDTRFVLQPRGSYSLLRTPKFELGIEGNGYFSWHDDLSNFDVASYQAGPFASYRLTPNLYASARYGFNYVELGNDPFLTRNIVTPQMTLVEPKFGYTSAYYQFQAAQFDDRPSRPELDRDGQRHTIGVVQGITLGEIFKGGGPSNLELSYRFENQETKGDDYDGDFHTVGATLYAPLPVWKLRGDVGVAYSYDGYDNPNSLDSDGDRRRDLELNVTTGVTRQLFPNCSVRVDYTYTDRNSNIETAAGQSPFDYDRHQVGVRLIFSY